MVPIALLLIAGGTVSLYAGIKGQSPLEVVQNLVTSSSSSATPPTVKVTNPKTGANNVGGIGTKPYGPPSGQ